MEVKKNIDISNNKIIYKMEKEIFRRIKKRERSKRRG